MGGVALNDPSQGMLVKVWTLTLDGDDVVVSAADVSPVVLFTQSGITELSLAFDQNMRPTVAFVAGGQATIWWFDSVEGDQVFTNLPSGSLNPRVTLDDKRAMQIQAGVTDVILAYIRSNNLYFRAQRDRYLIEYLLAAGVNRTLRKVAMNDKLRLQFEMGPVTV
jgi:hypothetical protein